jgi:hypothetical protein
VPSKFRYRYIDLFKKTPGNFAGIAGSGVLKRIIKFLDRFGIVTIFLPFVLLAICLAMLPDWSKASCQARKVIWKKSAGFALWPCPGR